MWANRTLFLTSNHSSNYLVVSFFIANNENLTRSKSTSKTECIPKRPLPWHVAGKPSSPQSQSQTEQPYNRADKGTYLCGQDAEGLTKTNPGPLCGWWEGERVWLFTCQWSNPSSSDPGRAGVQARLAQPGPVLLPSPFSLLPGIQTWICWLPAGTWQTSLWGICHPLQALSLGKYISRQAVFSNYPMTSGWERWML